MNAARQIDPATDAAVRQFLLSIKQRPDYAGAVLFGSRARGTHDPDSDADVAILLNGPPGSTVGVAVEMAGAAYDVLLHTGINIHALPVWMEEWESPQSYANPGLLRNIQAEGIVL